MRRARGRNFRRRGWHDGWNAVSGDPSSLPPLVRLWLWRILVRVRWAEDVLEKNTRLGSALVKVLDLGDGLFASEDGSLEQNAKEQLCSHYEAAEKKLGKEKAPETLRKNVSHLGKLVGLSPAECRILEFTVLMKNIPLLHVLLREKNPESKKAFLDFLAQVLDLPQKSVREALRQNGMLRQSGLLHFMFTGTFEPFAEILDINFAEEIFCEKVTPSQLLRFCVSKGAAPELSLAHYAHLAQPIKILRTYLKAALAEQRKGVNIFVYGPPGTGKTQLARVLAQELSSEIFEVLAINEDGDPIAGPSRLRAFCMAQVLLQKKSSGLILFDEMEDSFSVGDSDDWMAGILRDRKTHYGKAMKNQLLEENPTPTIWISNSRAFDPAFLRRFDVVLEMPVPPKRERARILHATCADLFSPSEVAWLAESETLAPAVVARAASVARAVKEELGETDTRLAFEFLVESTLGAQGHTIPRKHDPNRLPELYDPAFIHADTDLSRVAEGILRTRAGRLCLYGPPGTGKTAYGRFLAEQMGVPLCVKRASDLLSKWVGESEKNIALAFREAERESGVLLIDEIDTFLQDRRGAQRSWEMTLVNEMLTQIESFPGVLIASTNLCDVLDQAAFRRFDFKVKFDFLRPEQAVALLRRHAATLGLSEPSVGEAARMSRFAKLTPGDFATVLRQSRFAPFADCTELLAALEAEVVVKAGKAQEAIGFLC